MDEEEFNLDDEPAPAATTEAPAAVAPAAAKEDPVTAPAPKVASPVAKEPAAVAGDAPKAAAPSTEEKAKKLCFSFNSEAGCAKGDECKFAHEKGEIDPKVLERMAKSAGECLSMGLG